MRKIEEELLFYLNKLVEHLPNSELAKVMVRCRDILKRQRDEAIALHNENDELRRRLVRAQEGLRDARAAIQKLQGEGL